MGTAQAETECAVVRFLSYYRDIYERRQFVRDRTEGLDHRNPNANSQTFKTISALKGITRYMGFVWKPQFPNNVIFAKAPAEFQVRGFDPALLRTVDVFGTPGSMARYW
jgi:hypothetical protein